MLFACIATEWENCFCGTEDKTACAQNICGFEGLLSLRAKNHPKQSIPLPLDRALIQQSPATSSIPNWIFLSKIFVWLLLLPVASSCVGGLSASKPSFLRNQNEDMLCCTPQKIGDDPGVSHSTEKLYSLVQGFFQ